MNLKGVMKSQKTLSVIIVIFAIVIDSICSVSLFGIPTQSANAEDDNYQSMISQPLDLSRVESLCLQKNQEITASNYQEISTRFAYLQSQSGFLPSIQLSGGLIKQGGVPKGFTREISVSQALIAPELTAQIAQKRLQWCAAILQTIELKNRLLLSVRAAYFNCILKKAMRQEHLNRIELMKMSLDQEKSNLAVGRSTSLNVNEIQVALLQAVTECLQSTQEEKTAKDQLESLLGLQSTSEIISIADQEICPEKIPFLREKMQLLPKDVLSLADRIESIEKERGAFEKFILFDQKSAENFEKCALFYQPGLRKAELQLALEGLLVKEKKARYLPNLSANCITNNINYPNGTKLNGRQRWQTQIDMSWTLFDGFARERGLRSVKFKADALKYQLIKQKNDLKRKICEHLNAIETRLMAYSSARQGAEVAELALQLAKDRYKSGEITPFVFRQSSNELICAKVQRASAALDAIMAYFALVSDCAFDQIVELRALDSLIKK